MDAEELQRCLTQTGISGTYARKLTGIKCNRGKKKKSLSLNIV